MSLAVNLIKLVVTKYYIINSHINGFDKVFCKKIYWLQTAAKRTCKKNSNALFHGTENSFFLLLLIPSYFSLGEKKEPAM